MLSRDDERDVLLKSPRPPHRRGGGQGCLPSHARGSTLKVRVQHAYSRVGEATLYGRRTSFEFAPRLAERVLGVPGQSPGIRVRLRVRARVRVRLRHLVSKDSPPGPPREFDLGLEQNPTILATLATDQQLALGTDRLRSSHSDARQPARPRSYRAPRERRSVQPALWRCEAGGSAHRKWEDTGAAARAAAALVPPARLVNLAENDARSAPRHRTASRKDGVADRGVPFSRHTPGRCRTMPGASLNHGDARTAAAAAGEALRVCSAHRPTSGHTGERAERGHTASGPP